MRNTPSFSQAEQVIARGLRDGAFTAASLLVGQNDRVLYRRAFGRLSIDDDAPLCSEQTRYDLASIT